MLEKILNFIEIFGAKKENPYIITTANTSLINITRKKKVLFDNIIFIKNPKSFQINFSKDYITYDEGESWENQQPTPTHPFTT